MEAEPRFGLDNGGIVDIVRQRTTDEDLVSVARNVYGLQGAAPWSRANLVTKTAHGMESWITEHGLGVSAFLYGY
jgi:hypothetical protein